MCIRDRTNTEGGSREPRPTAARGGRGATDSSPLVGALGRDKTDRFAALQRRRRHELADRIKHDFELRVVLALECCELASQIYVRRKDSAEADERPHDLD